MVDPSPENIAKVKQALAFLPDNAAAELADEDVSRYTVVRVADEVVVDLLGSACGVIFAEAIEEADWIEIGAARMPVANKETLIRTKQTIRPSDHADCEFLAARLAEES